MKCVNIINEMYFGGKGGFCKFIGDVTEPATWGRTNYSNQMFACACAGPDPPHGYSDSSDMLKIILQMVQNQDRVVKDLYTHLR